jgi:hypothetical protein
MGDIWWVIIICPCVNVFTLMGGVTEADVGFPTGFSHGEIYSIQHYVIKFVRAVTCGRTVFFSGYSGSSTNKTDCHDITEILLKVSLNTLTI